MRAARLLALLTAIVGGAGASSPAQELPGTEDQPLAGVEAPAAEESLDRAQASGGTLRLHLEFMDLAAPSALAPSELMSIANEREFRMALWNAPLGRVNLELVREQAMLGREGLVGGGHMLGVGLGTMALGDGTPSPFGLGFDRQRWAEMSFKERLKTSFQVSLTLGVLAALVDALN